MFLGKIFLSLYLTHGVLFSTANTFYAGPISNWSNNETHTSIEEFIVCVTLLRILQFTVEKPAHNLGRIWENTG